LLYTEDLLRLIGSRGLRPHAYADDTQIYGSCLPFEVTQLEQQVSSCIDDVAAWIRCNRLQLNTAKTEVLWCASSRRHHQIATSCLRVSMDFIPPSGLVRHLGIYIDSKVTMKNHVSKTVSSCFCVLRQLRSISRSVTSPVLQSLAVSLVLSRLDYGNAVLAGLPRYLLDRMQSVLNAAARLVCSARKYDPVTPLLCDLHWLRVPERIDFKLAVLVYRCIHGMAPPYLAGDLCRVADILS